MKKELIAFRGKKRQDTKNRHICFSCFRIEQKAILPGRSLTGFAGYNKS